MQEGWYKVHLHWQKKMWVQKHRLEFSSFINNAEEKL